MNRISDYDYHLPEELIAQTPLEDRASSRLLVLNRASGSISDHTFRDVGALLRPGDLLVLNNTRVTARRITGTRSTGGHFEVLLLRELGGDTFECLVKPAKRIRIGDVLDLGDEVRGEVVDAGPEGFRSLRLTGPNWKEKLSRLGQVPLPPYIVESLNDENRYQTVFAEKGGSAAAPTAGLHFTPELLAELSTNGIKIAFVTLDVGIDTFRPVTAENLSDHKMHGEVCTIPSETAQAISECTGRIIAVGTTTVRTLESFAIGPRRVETGEKSTELFIRPGFEFRVVDGLFTNFHLPRTTLLVMLSAFIGRDRIFSAYEHAIAEKYRFLSFGDSMFIV